MITASEAYNSSHEVYKQSYIGKIWTKIEDAINLACKEGKFKATVSVPDTDYKEIMNELNKYGYSCTYGRGYLEQMDRTMSICITWNRPF